MWLALTMPLPVGSMVIGMPVLGAVLSPQSIWAV
jgi:hypothetical protein